MKKCISILLLMGCISGFAAADTKYVLVQSELNVRARPSLGSHVHGRLFTGDAIQVSRTYRGWHYLEGLHSEEGCGWVATQYVVDDPVVEMDGVSAVVQANGRVAIRDSVSGKRVAWVQPGEIVYVFGMSDSWSVTDRGYVKTEYLVLNE